MLTNFSPRNGFGPTLVKLFQTPRDLLLPSCFNIGISRGVEALQERTGEQGALLFGQAERSLQKFGPLRGSYRYFTSAAANPR